MKKVERLDQQQQLIELKKYIENLDIWLKTEAELLKEKKDQQNPEIEAQHKIDLLA